MTASIFYLLLNPTTLLSEDQAGNLIYGEMKEISGITEQNSNDEIQLYSITNVTFINKTSNQVHAHFNANYNIEGSDNGSLSSWQGTARIDNGKNGWEVHITDLKPLNSS